MLYVKHTAWLVMIRYRSPIGGEAIEWPACQEVRTMRAMQRRCELLMALQPGPPAYDEANPDPMRCCDSRRGSSMTMHSIE